MDTQTNPVPSTETELPDRSIEQFSSTENAASAERSGTIPFNVPSASLAERKLMPASWQGPSGTSKSRTLVKAMNNARKAGILLNRLESVEFTPAELTEWKNAGFETGIESATWARFGFTPDQARTWKDNGINNHDAYNYARLGANPIEVATAMRNYPSNNAPSDTLINAYVESRKEFAEKLPLGTPDEKINEMNDKWGDWGVDKAIALDASGYSHKEANYAYFAGKSDTVESIMEFADRQRSLHHESDVTFTRGEGDSKETLSARDLFGSEWAEYLSPIPEDESPEPESGQE